MKKLTDEEFLFVIEHTPLVAIDLIIKNKYNEILLGLRNNNPARGFLFTPGGRVRKNEKLNHAFSRICKNELGLICEIGSAHFCGIFEHFYSENFADKDNIGTHYIILAYKIYLDIDLDILPKSQHNNYQWKNINDLLTDSKVHQNTKDYFLQSNYNYL